MAGGRRWGLALAAASLLLAAAPAGAQEKVTPPTYKCASKGHVRYADKPCPGGREMGPAGARKTDKYDPPPQDRARAARRAQLAPEAREECGRLETVMQEQEAEFKAKGPGATVQDETPLVKSRLRYRELKC